MSEAVGNLKGSGNNGSNLEEWWREVLGVLSYVATAAAAAAKSLQSCPALHDPINGSPPGSPIPGILQARTLEWVAISFSNAWKGKVKVKSLSRVWLLATPWTAAYQPPPPMGFSRQEYPIHLDWNRRVSVFRKEIFLGERLWCFLETLEILKDLIRMNSWRIERQLEMPQKTKSCTNRAVLSLHFT